jgi:hypothetical protein
VRESVRGKESGRSKQPLGNDGKDFHDLNYKKLCINNNNI